MLPSSLITSHHCCPFLPLGPLLSSELWFSHHLSIHPHWFLLNNIFCPITVSRLFISYNSLMTSHQSWTHLPLLCPALSLGCFDHSFLASFLTLSLLSAHLFFPTVPPSISQSSEDSLFILRPLAVSSFKISPSPAFSQLIDFLFNGFSGPISFSLPPHSPFLPCFLSHDFISLLHHSDGQITILIKFLHTHAHIWLQNNTRHHACKPLRIMGHLHHPFLCL